MPNLRWIKNNGKEELYDGDVKLAYLYKRKNDFMLKMRTNLIGSISYYKTRAAAKKYIENWYINIWLDSNKEKK